MSWWKTTKSLPFDKIISFFLKFIQTDISSENCVPAQMHSVITGMLVFLKIALNWIVLQRNKSFIRKLSIAVAFTQQK